MKKKIILLILVLIFVQHDFAFANIFSMDYGNGSSGQPGQNADDIPVRNEAYKLVQKRKKEAQELIFEGRQLIKKGEKKKDKNLITKGQIKKEIGEKQLHVLKEQEQNNKKDQSYGW